MNDYPCQRFTEKPFAVGKSTIAPDQINAQFNFSTPNYIKKPCTVITHTNSFINHDNNNQSVDQTNKQKMHKISPYNIDFIVRDLGVSKPSDNVDAEVRHVEDINNVTTGVTYDLNAASVPEVNLEKEYYNFPNQTQFDERTSFDNAQITTSKEKPLNSNFLSNESCTKNEMESENCYQSEINSEMHTEEYKVKSRNIDEKIKDNLGTPDDQLNIVDVEKKSINCNEKIILPPKKSYFLDKQQNIEENVFGKDQTTKHPTKIVILEDITIRGKLDKKNPDDVTKVVKCAHRSRQRRSKCDKNIPPIPFKITPSSEINVPIPRRVKTVENTINKVYISANKCNEVKHATTPLQEDPKSLQTHTPQLPTPPSNFPVQIESSSCHKNPQNLPHLIVPTTYNVNRISGLTHQPHLVASQSKLTDTHSVDLTRIKANAVAAAAAAEKARAQIDGGGEFTVLIIPSLKHSNHDMLINSQMKKVKVSRIEFAMRKRKLRKLRRTTNKETPKSKKSKLEQASSTSSKNGVVTMEWGIPVVGYSNSDTSSSCNSSDYDSDPCPVDLNIKNGPAQKPSPEKIHFLNHFGLATPGQKDSVEFKKLETRHWLTPWTVSREKQKKKITPLKLPVPSHSPLVLNKTKDYNLKKAFFNTLELTWVSPDVQKEFEQTWVKVIHDRMKRDCDSALTKYSIQAYRKRQCSILKPVELKNISSKPQRQPQDALALMPIVHQYAHLKM
ncbi:unnamed protein product [Brassicogethes aeneus]|uniref:Genetic suppressor element-like domain-containing protein n=1 Tax=Brassicogethes aeneus TaxID=1431903 RepID=A0A9P0AVZ4_BRAAE|nr:unnamed protein product [Brassicogethes aeneus]